MPLTLRLYPGYLPYPRGLNPDHLPYPRFKPGLYLSFLLGYTRVIPLFPVRVYPGVIPVSLLGWIFPFHCWVGTLCAGFIGGFEPLSHPGVIPVSLLVDVVLTLFSTFSHLLTFLSEPPFLHVQTSLFCQE